METKEISLYNSQLIEDINDIIKPHKDKYVSTFNFKIKLHTEKKDLDYTDGIFLVQLDIIRDFVNNISDYIEAIISIPFGTFMFDVYNYLDNIEITLIYNRQLYNGDKPIEIIERYKAVFLLDKNPKLPNMTNYNKVDLNNQMPLSITFQLIDRSVETLRIKTLTGSFDKAVNSNKSNSIDVFLKSVISEQANKILIENKPCLDNIFIEKVDNTQELKSITIPSNTRVVELPSYIQNKNIGIYNGDIGIYISKFNLDTKESKKTLFIYSLYNNKKYNDSEYKMIFYSPLTSDFSLGDITYKYEDKILKIVANSISSLEDKRESYLMSSGSGFRISNSESYMKKPVEIKDGKAKFKRSELNTEIVFKERKDGLNFARNLGITGNMFKITSNIFKENGIYVTFNVNNVDPWFLLPCYKCKIVYVDKNNKVDEIYGVLNDVSISFKSDKLDIPFSMTEGNRSLYCVSTIKMFINSD